MGPAAPDLDPAARGGRDLSGSGFFVLRTALLPLDELLAWSEGLRAARADEGELEEVWAADRAQLRARLAAAVERPEVLDALFVASPDLHDSLRLWRRDPDGKKGQRAERSLVRYFTRMAARPTPFGLFSGCTVGALGAPGESTDLSVAGRETYQRHSRLDMNYLAALSEDLDRDPALRAVLTYRPNSSLYRAAGRLRYAEGRMLERRRHYYLVAVEATDYLEETLRRAEGGARRAELAAALSESDPDGEITLEEAEEYVDSLIDAQILVSDLSPLLTGPEPIHDLIDRLRPHPEAAPVVERLEQTRRGLEEIDARGPGVPAESYRAIAARLEELPTRVELPRLFQVDMVKPEGRAMLGGEVIAELERGIALLRRLMPPLEPGGLDRFRTQFVERYGEGREVPLAEALDDEVGIGFERLGDAGAEPSPLLARLRFPGTAADPALPWGTRQEVLLEKLEEALASGTREIDLDTADLDRMASPNPPALPASMLAMAVLAAPSRETLDQGDFRVLLHNVSGPSAARLLGRFCHADPALLREVEAHLRAEEALDPEAVFAEIVHLPEGRVGNVLCRPVLRAYEIPYLGRSGVPEDRLIPLGDLRVTVASGRIVLRSARLGRRVVPRLTSAHTFNQSSLRIYRFLGTLQNQGDTQFLTWSWGALRAASFLPRVRSGRLVLHRARWQARRRELEELGRATGAARFRAVQRWRERRGLPRFVVVSDGDNELTVDLDNALAVDSFVDLVQRRPSVALLELFPGPEDLCARGPEGRLVHDLLVPFLFPQPAIPAARAPREEARPAALEASPVRRSFPPGSEWLYAKLYTGTATGDQLLRDLVAPLRERALASGAADGWFFLRYADPEWHLRVRFHGDPARLHGEVLPWLERLAAPLLDEGWLWKLQLDTYDREVERYGGAEGIELAERIFHADSEAVLAILEAFQGDQGAEARWRLALAGSDLLLADLGLDPAARLAFFRLLRDKSDFAHQLGERFRPERPALERLLEGDGGPDLGPGLEALRRRSAALAPLAAELRAREAAGRLLRPVEILAQSHVHMHVNRMIRAAANEHERVLYDFLARLYESRAARGG